MESEQQPRYPQSISEHFGVSNERYEEMVQAAESAYDEVVSRENGGTQVDFIQVCIEKLPTVNQMEAFFYGGTVVHRFWMERYMPDESNLVESEE